jgi:hypothetical protein
MNDDIRGEYTEITEPLQSTVNAKNPMALAYAAMLDELRMLAIPHLPVNPEPEHFEDVADFGLRVAGCFDRFWHLVGDEAQSVVTCNLDIKCFTNTFTDALQGFSTFELDRAAGVLREDDAEARQASRYGRSARTLIGMIRGERGI